MANEIKVIREKLRQLYDYQYTIESSGGDCTNINDLIFDYECREKELKNQIFECPLD